MVVRIMDEWVDHLQGHKQGVLSVLEYYVGFFGVRTVGGRPGGGRKGLKLDDPPTSQAADAPTEYSRSQVFRILLPVPSPYPQPSILQVMLRNALAGSSRSILASGVSSNTHLLRKTISERIMSPEICHDPRCRFPASNTQGTSCDHTESM